MPTTTEAAPAWRRWGAGLAVALLLVVGGTFVWIACRSDPVVSDPAMVRDPDRLAELRDTSRPVPEVDTTFPEGLEIVRTNRAEVKIKSPLRQAPDRGPVYGYTVHEFDARSVLRIGEGEVRLDYVGVAYGEFQESPDEYSVRLPGRFFDHELQEMPPDEVERRFRKWDRELDYRGTFPQVHTVRFIPDGDPPQTTFAFLGIPQANPVPVDFQFLNHEGEKLQGGGGGSASAMKIVSTRARRAEVATVLARRYTQFKRLIIRLPEIPGLPDNNRGIENLFDVRIPHLLVRRQDDLPELLGKVVQMDVRTVSTVSLPPVGFPRFYTNATPRDLLADLERLQRRGTTLKVDSAEHAIRAEPPAWERWLERLKRFF